MPAIKITLPRLIELFGKSVNSDLPAPVKALAARLMTLTAHTVRIEQKADAQTKALGKQIAELAEIVHALVPAQVEPTATAPSAPPATPATKAAPPSEPGAEQEEGEEEESEEEFFARAQQEAEAEVAAINASVPAEPEPAPVAVLPARGKKAGGAK